MKQTEYARFRSGKASEIKRLELEAKAFRDFILKQISTLGIKSGTKVLDAGCGTGSFARMIAPIASPARVTAVDIEPIFIGEARRRATRQETTSNIDFEVGDMESLRFPDETFDVSRLGLVLAHIKDALKTVFEMKRVTRKGGLVASADEGDLFTYPPIEKFFGLFGKIAQWRKATQKLQSSVQMKMFTHATSKENAYSLFTKAGLHDVRVFPIANYASSQENPGKLREFTTVPVMMLEIHKDEVISRGFMTQGDYEEGISELQQWLPTPDSFWMVLGMLTIGTVA
jgi:ubiquinone/menaquinone biosynthesis C-methylase UbiE